jgi:3-amino-5-hydroxybenzoate synthase
VGNFGEVGTFSFQQGKLLTAGEGGAVVTNDPELERKARSIHDCGRLPGEWFYAHFQYGSNYRMTEWQGAILRKQLERLPAQGEIRTRNAAYLDQALGKIPGITPQRQDIHCTQNGHYAYIFHYNAQVFGGLTRSEFVKKLETAGIPIQASYPPLHELDVFQSGAYRSRLTTDQDYGFLIEQAYPNTAKGAWETVWLPQYVLLAEEEVIAHLVGVVAGISTKETRV